MHQLKPLTIPGQYEMLYIIHEMSNMSVGKMDSEQAKNLTSRPFDA